VRRGWDFGRPVEEGVRAVFMVVVVVVVVVVVIFVFEVVILNGVDEGT
jgi:hypothetical protein